MGVHVITARLIGDQGAFRKVSRRFRAVAQRELQRFGNEAATRIKDYILSDQVKPAKESHDGHPTLVHTATYVNSIKAQVNDLTVSVAPTGRNRIMSNEALGELLEYGFNGQPPRPHWRILAVWVERNLTNVGERIARELLGRT
jgi:hypothetical protein